MSQQRVRKLWGRVRPRRTGVAGREECNPRPTPRPEPRELAGCRRGSGLEHRAGRRSRRAVAPSPRVPPARRLLCCRRCRGLLLTGDPRYPHYATPFPLPTTADFSFSPRWSPFARSQWSPFGLTFAPGSDPVGAAGLLPAECSPKLLEGGGSCGDLPDGRRDDPQRFAAPRREPSHPRREGSQPGCLARATSSHRSTGRAEQRQNSRLDEPLLWSDHATSSGWHPRKWRSDDDNNESRQGLDAVQSGGGDSGSP